MRTIFLLAMLSFFGCSQPAAQSTKATAPPAIQLDVAKLQELESLDLRDLDIDSDPELAALFVQFRHPINPDSIDWDLIDTEPWFVWKYKDHDQTPYWLIFMGKPLMVIPGESAAKLQFVDTQGRIAKSLRFSTGWRIDLLSAQWNYDADLECYCLNIPTEQVINGEDIARRVYAIHELQPILLWAENSGGKIIPRMFAEESTYPSIQKEAEFEQYLNSPKPVHICEALWLLTNGDYEILKQPPIRTRIEELSQGENRRLKTLALRVLKSLEKPPNRWEREE